ncbi:rhodanese-like domain-containing protein [Sediminibacterium soli]|uniref:rhodanese-like domain-containing protein n=1 Tax=Sediminibacterium soli TaxID=2698829 RepID=UPI00137A9A95|nr:rhodanese-like domain-containing protein [Sediminibacterium soli]NCI47887.1 rhodanese-like domain-containing protein [Sediminibacterium soli]
MNNNPTVIDVRTPAEYATGCVTGSINIPLAELSQRSSEIQGLPQPILLCCASGIRSGQAASLLRNGGSWFDVDLLINKK